MEKDERKGTWTRAISSGMEEEASSVCGFKNT
jgi:hypothetical protein